MSIAVQELKGVTEEIASALHALGIQNTTQLLAATETPAARAKLAAALGVDAGIALELANRADLLRIRGLTMTYAELMTRAGVDSVLELSRRIPENLYPRLLLAASFYDIHEFPRLDTVCQWVSEARQLQRAIYF